VARAKLVLKPPRKPITRDMFVDSGDPHLCGPIIVELNDKGIAWWHDVGDPDYRADVRVITAEMIVGSCFLTDVDHLRRELDSAGLYLEAAKKRVVALDRIRSFKVID
jgi:hypothetical protein